MCLFGQESHNSKASTLLLDQTPQKIKHKVKDLVKLSIRKFNTKGTIVSEKKNETGTENQIVMSPWLFFFYIKHDCLLNLGGLPSKRLN